MLRAVALSGCLAAGCLPTHGLLDASVAMAQTSGSAGSTVSGGSKSMNDLLSEGYEIKSSVPNGTKFIVLMQKDKTAYACEFVTLTKSRCGAIN